MNRFTLSGQLLCSAILAATLSTIVHADTEWTSYYNDRFGVTADVPKGWKMDQPPANNDGRIFTSPDGAATLVISGNLNLEDNVDAAFAAYEAPAKDRTITYKKRVGQAITVSGTSGKNVFFGKHLLSCHNQIWNSVYLEYPAERKADFDAIAAHAARSLKSGPGYQISKCGK